VEFQPEAPSGRSDVLQATGQNSRMIRLAFVPLVNTFGANDNFLCPTSYQNSAKFNFVFIGFRMILIKNIDLFP
jgi:hypothetical protein